MSATSTITPIRLLKAPEVCTILSISRASLARLVARGGIRTVAIGGARRFRSDDVDKIIAGMPPARAQRRRAA